jgi:protein-S-isoprenylcysteine O-methyltransferase Ste14
MKSGIKPGKNSNIYIMEIIGKPTINPVIFYTGKFSGYFTWIVMILLISGITVFKNSDVARLERVTYFLIFVGAIFIVFSCINLGKSTRLGIPSGETVLKSGGIYRISRNPMYVGFNLITLASVVYSQHLIVAIIGLYSILTYHFIILGEERFLNERFGKDYRDYKKQVSRYF